MTTQEQQTLKPPPPTKSVFSLTSDFYFQWHLPSKKPNWFWRKMQWLFFGFHWRDYKEKE